MGYARRFTVISNLLDMILSGNTKFFPNGYIWASKWCRFVKSSGKTFKSSPLNFSRLENVTEELDHSIKRKFQSRYNKIDILSTYINANFTIELC